MTETLRQPTLAPDTSGGEATTPAVRTVGFDPGTPVAEYRIVRRLGQGGMGCVYEARDTELNRTVALKTLLPGSSVDAATRDQILAEARALAAVGNDHVVTVHRVGVHEGSPYVVMELLTGESLAATLARGPMPLLQVLKIARELANGLSAAHQAGIVHRDVKPDNVILDGRRDRAVLVDFGLASAREPQGGNLVGTPAYMAPEQLRGGTVDGRTDLYSFGAVLYRMCTGQLPLAVESITLWRNTLLSDHVPVPADRVNPSAPPPLARLIDRLLAKVPADRPATAADVEWELLDIFQSAFAAATNTRLSGMVPTGGPKRRLSKPRRTSGSWAVASLAAAAVGLVVMTHTGGSGTPNPNVVLPRSPIRTGLGDPVSLFDGRTLAGWRGADGATDRWTVADGVLVGTPFGEDQFLLSDGEFADFVLEFEFRWRAKNAHTSVLLRGRDRGPLTPQDRLDGKGRVCGVEVNVGDEVEGDVPPNPLYASGGVYLARGPRVFPPNRPIGEWNTVRVTADGPQLRIEWNGVTTFDENLERFAHKTNDFPAFARPKGVIALHTHGPQPIEYRSLVITPLSR